MKESVIMKRIVLLSITTVFAFFVLSCCSGCENSNKSKRDLVVGKWYCLHNGKTEVGSFENDGTIHHSYDIDNEPLELTGYFKVDGDNFSYLSSVNYSENEEYWKSFTFCNDSEDNFINNCADVKYTEWFVSDNVFFLNGKMMYSYDYYKSHF